VEKQMVKKAPGDQSYVSYVLMKNKLNLKDVKQIDVHAERLDKCAIVDASQILLVVSDTQYMLHCLCFQCQTPHQLFQ
jgi:hypothetical protein